MTLDLQSYLRRGAIGPGTAQVPVENPGGVNHDYGRGQPESLRGGREADKEQELGEQLDWRALTPCHSSRAPCTRGRGRGEIRTSLALGNSPKTGEGR